MTAEQMLEFLRMIFTDKNIRVLHRVAGTALSNARNDNVGSEADAQIAYDCIVALAKLWGVKLR
jgi:hypothetical protein